MFIRMMVLVKTGLDDLPCRFVYSGRSKKEESWEDGADFLPFEPNSSLFPISNFPCQGSKGLANINV